jgi:hypothetical protein
MPFFSSPLPKAHTSDGDTPDDDPFDGEIDSNATPETISSLTGVSDAPVGLSNAQYVQQKRKMLDAVNRLRGTGYGDYDHYPSIRYSSHVTLLPVALNWTLTYLLLSSSDLRVLESRLS